MIVDVHSHILPGIDDGSRSVEESIAMLKLEWEQGIRRVVATPHFYPHQDSPERFLARRDRAEKQLREEMSRFAELPQVEMGAEVYFFPGISRSDRLSQLTIGEKRCILIEMPYAPWTDSMYRELEEIYTRQDLVPIIAHVDRYIKPLRTHGIPERLVELPVLVQANADFFLGSSRFLAMRLLREDKIHLLGSDCHNLDSRRPNLGAAVQRIGAALPSQVISRLRAYGETV